jgi:hypothetical protein
VGFPFGENVQGLFGLLGGMPASDKRRLAGWLAGWLAACLPACRLAHTSSPTPVYLHLYLFYL